MLLAQAIEEKREADAKAIKAFAATPAIPSNKIPPGIAGRDFSIHLRAS